MKKNVIHQLKTDGRPLEGMSYILESDDGSIIAVDGGMDYDVEPLYRYLRNLSGDKDPVVDAWIITHAHPDHNLALRRLGEGYADRMTVKKLIFRQPEEEWIQAIQPGVLEQLPPFYDALKNFKGMEYVTPSAGDHYRFGSMDIEILFTCADLPPVGEGPLQRFNDSSTVFRVSAEGQTILFPGDAQDAADRVMIDRYGKDLKSDGVQMAHHGDDGSTAEFYAAVDPDFVFWPGLQGFPEVSLFHREANRVLFSNGHIRDVYIAGEGTRRKEFPLQPDLAPQVLRVPELYRPVTPRYELKEAKVLPDITDPEDPAWEQAQEMDPNGSYDGSRKGAYARLRALWSEDALYVKAGFFRENIVYDPDEIRADKCHNVRVHLAETPLTDLSRVWDDFTGNGEYLRDLRLYPEQKNISGAKAFNNKPERCESFAVPGNAGFEICAKISFAKKHRAGDIIGFHTEINAVQEYKGERTLRMTLADDEITRFYRAFPAAMVYWKLV